MIMASTIQEALRPLFITCFIMGLGVYPIKQLKSKSQWIAHLGLLYSLIVWFVYGYMLYYTVTIFTLTELVGIYMVKIVVFLSIITSIMSAIVTFHYRKKFEICIEKLATVDDTLEELGTPKMYRKMYMWSIGTVFGWIIFAFIINVYDTIWWWNTEKMTLWGLLVAYILNHPIHINAFMDLLFIFFLRYVATRFDKVNEHMQCLLVKEEHKLRFTWKNSTPSWQHKLRINNYKRTLWTSMHLHLELCRIARELNFMFETQIAAEAVSILLYLTAMCYYLFLTIVLIQINRVQMVISLFLDAIVWIFTLLMRFYAINHICESVKFKANKIKKIIHQLANSLQYSTVWKEVQQFSLQTMQNPLEFTGMGLFNLGNECLQKFCMTIVTFVIILIQLQMPSDIRIQNPTDI